MFVAFCVFVVLVVSVEFRVFVAVVVFDVLSVC